MLRGSTRDKGRAPIQHSAEAHDEFVSLSLRDNVWESERACKYIRSGQREGIGIQIIGSGLLSGQKGGEERMNRGYKS